MTAYKKIILPNGLRVVLVPKLESLATTVLVLVEAGSKYETKAINGLSHFLEHMCFKGTTKRPRSIDITNELNNIGAEYNAFTGQELTGYFVKALSKDLDIALDVVADIYVNSLFDEQEIEKEKGVVVEEINMNEDRLPRKAQILFSELLYGNQPAGWEIAGTPTVVRSLKREDFLKYRGEHYVAQATTIIVAGAFDEAELLKKIEEKFKNMPAQEKQGKLKVIESQEKPAIKLKFKESDQSHLVLGVRAYDLFDKRRFALELLADILGNGFGSRLFERLREQMGVAYYVGADADLSTDHGALIASAGVDAKRLTEVIKAILEECKRLRDETVPADELTRIKNRISGNMVLGLETSNALANYFGGQEILEKTIITPEELLQKLQVVTAEEIQAVAKDVFKDSKLNLVVIGPHKDESVFQPILHFN